MSNTMVAVCIVVIALTLVSIDMREDIVRKVSLICMAIIILCVGATIAATNPYIGFVINIIMLFGIVYQTMNNYSAPMYFPFALSYIFMLMSSPATFNELPWRLFSVIVGSIYILLVQLVLNKNRYEKTIFGTSQGILGCIKSQINNIVKGSYDNNLDNQVHNLVNIIVKAINDSKSRKKYLTNSNKGILEITLLLENISKYLEKYKNSSTLTLEENHELLEILDLISLIERYYSSQFKNKDVILKDIELLMDRLNGVYCNELKGIINKLPHYLEMTKMDTHKSRWDSELVLKNAIKKIDPSLYEFKFALKLSITISVVVFLVDILNIEYGRWIVFPMLAIIQPYYDNTLVKAKHRILGTLMGMVLFTILFSVIKDPTARLNTTIIAAYIGVFVTKYQYSTSIVAISALGASAIRGAGIEILIFRLLFTLLGCLISMIVNKYILHYKFKDSIIDLKLEYNNVVSELKEAEGDLSDDNNKYSLLIKKSLIEHKIRGEI